MDFPHLEATVQDLFTRGLSGATLKSYSSAQRRYLQFCDSYNLIPFPASEEVVTLFVALMAHQGLQPQTIKCYLSAIRFGQIAVGLPDFNYSQWPRLHYVLRGVKRSPSQPLSSTRRLPITINILQDLLRVWASDPDPFRARLLWAASCLGFFGFMRSGELTNDGKEPPAIRVGDVAVDSHTTPSILSVFLRRAKTDPFGKGVHIYLGRTGALICPISAILNYLVVRPAGDGPLFVWQDGRPLSRDRLVRELRATLSRTGTPINPSQYSGHSFRIGAATTAAAAGVPAHTIKMLGRWESEAYQLYIRTPRESLASLSRSLVAPRRDPNVRTP